MAKSANSATIELEESPEDANGKAAPAAGANGHGRTKTRRRATAQSMAASQRDISVSEFFAKNRHLLGFDNPRRCLRRSGDSAGDLGAYRADRHEPVQNRRPGQRTWHS
jgi:hypothetical protein